MNRMNERAWVAGLFVIVLLASAVGSAHVILDAPIGGEVLEPGTAFTIIWHDQVAHGPANYDLWYSTTGPDGPWNVIIEDRDFGGQQPSYSFIWTVPNTPSDHVRVRVRQDNLEDDYEDMSQSDLKIEGALATTEVSLEPSRDATLYEGDGTLANGAGSYLFTGATESQNNALERRALLFFDVESAIPAGATITAASLELTVSRTISGDQTVDLRRVTEAWSEGPSDPAGQEGGGAASQDGDTTWVHRSFPSNMWSSTGGAFASVASGSQQVGGNGSVTFDGTPEMIADLQQWLDTPVDNHGWALVMPSPATGGAKRFNSREHPSPSTRPKLTISYEGGSELPVSRIVIPAAARVAGVGGSFFVTTADVYNGGPTPAIFSLEWLPRNTNNSDAVQSADFTLGPGETIRFDDLLLDAFGLSDGVGAAAVLSNSEEVEVMTRTYNRGDEGTFGQSLPGVSDDELTPEGRRVLVLFLTENDEFRSNLGFANGGDFPITVRWEFFAADGSLLGTGSTSLPPFGNKQINQVLEDFAPVEAASAQVWTDTPGGRFTCYGSVLDNATSDPTTVLPR